jgi:hypothetical protein
VHFERTPGPWVRRWRSWSRWVTLAMLAHAFMVVAVLAERTRHHHRQALDDGVASVGQKWVTAFFRSLTPDMNFVTSTLLALVGTEHVALILGVSLVTLMVREGD